MAVKKLAMSKMALETTEQNITQRILIAEQLEEAAQKAEAIAIEAAAERKDKLKRKIDRCAIES